MKESILKRVEAGNFSLASGESRIDLLESSEFAFAHFNVGDGNATVGGGLVNGDLYYAVSLCSPEDNFDKKKGRNLVTAYMSGASGLEKCGKVGGNFQHQSTSESLLVALKYFLNSNRHLPRWAKKAPISLRGKYKGPRQAHECCGRGCCGNC